MVLTGIRREGTDSFHRVFRCEKAVVHHVEALIRRLETGKLRVLVATLRREQFGQSSERGRLLVEQLELAIADVDESRGAAEAEADIAAPAAPVAGRQSRPARSRRPSLPDHLPK